MIQLCAEYRCPVHIVHLSSANSLAALPKPRPRACPDRGNRPALPVFQRRRHRRRPNVV
ncbi:MAG: hypothetical protein WKG07_09510 [Hymenobacter sp.]